MKFIAEAYQEYAHRYQMQIPFCGTFMEMGLGKTVTTLNTISKLLKYEVSKVLVIAPKMVAENVWSDEIEKWDHLRHLTYSKILGNEKERKAGLPRRVKADIYIINYDNLPWLITTLAGGKWPFDMVVLDESSRVKNHNSVRFQALDIVMPYVKRLIELSGTPMGNGYHDLWAQIYLLDQGDRLGHNVTEYRKMYFEKNYSGWGFKLRDDSYKKQIMDSISDICVSMRQKDYLKLKDRIERRYVLHMPDKLAQRYADFKRDRIMELLESGKEITAFNAGVLYNKLLQFSNGAIYDEEGEVHEIHNIKLQALHEIVEDAAGSPVLCFFNFKHDWARIKEYCKAFNPVKLKTKEDMRKWNRGEIQLACVHPASAGHGLNLQSGGYRIVFFGHQWSSELRKQAIARLERKGQTDAVILTDMVLAGTMDEQVLKALARKDADESDLMDYISAMVKGYKKELPSKNKYRGIKEYI